VSSIPANLKYTKEHEWVASTDNPHIFRIGITDFAQGALGDIVYIQLPKIGESVTAEKVCGEVESTKSVSEIYAPLSGKVVTVNLDLDKAPETINTDPYGTGWIAEIEISGDLTGAPGLLSAEQYEQLTA
jgi:glycine cleavage system H protein